MTDEVLELFHPAVQTWFRSAFAGPTPPQVAAWPAIKSGRHALVAAPTGSGKTLAAFLSAIDALVRTGVERGLPDETHVVYVSPLKALSNDVQRNLEAPLAGIRDALAAQGLPEVAIRTLARTGDTPQADRQSMRKRPPHIVVTTPESLHPAYERIRAANARDDADRDRRRDPRPRPEQARCPSRAVARAVRGARRTGPRPHRALGHAEADRRDRAVPDRRQRVRHRRHGPRGAPRPCDRAAVLTARSGDVRRSVAAGV